MPIKLSNVKQVTTKNENVLIYITFHYLNDKTFKSISYIGANTAVQIDSMKVQFILKPSRSRLESSPRLVCLLPFFLTSSLPIKYKNAAVSRL